MILPIRTDSPLRSTPWINWALIAANIVAFMLQKAYPSQVQNYTLDPERLSLYQFITYAFLHQDFLHIFGNMLFLYIFGNNINDKLGNAGYLAFYLAGAVFSGVGHVWSSDNPVLGASGAVSAVTGAYLILLPRSHITVLYFFYMVGTWEVASVWLILFYFLKDVLMASTGGGEVAYMAHISGTLFGSAVCFSLLALNVLPRDFMDVFSIVKHRARRAQYQGLVRKGYDPFNPTNLTNPDRVPVPLDPKAQQILALRSRISEMLGERNVAGATALYLQLKTIDRTQVLGRQAQLDIANQLASQQQYPQAVEAYEMLLQQYPSFDQIEHVELMTGIIYSRYLQQYERATQHLHQALNRLHNERDIEMARNELNRIEPFLSGNTTEGKAQ